MKKTPFIGILLGIMAFSLTQNCTYDRKQPETGQAEEAIDTLMKPAKKIYLPKETVTIYLACIKQTGENGDTAFHLALFDANGDYYIDSLTTLFLPQGRKPGHIKWRKVHQSGIREIVEIKYAGGGVPRIFQNGVSSKPGDEWNLDLPADILDYVGKDGRTEKYLIKYIPENRNDTVLIDPYLRVPPQP